jgi:hypothetical protein
MHSVGHLSVSLIASNYQGGESTVIMNGENDHKIRGTSGRTEGLRSSWRIASKQGTTNHYYILLVPLAIFLSFWEVACDQQLFIGEEKVTTFFFTQIPFLILGTTSPGAFANIAEDSYRY